MSHRGVRGGNMVAQRYPLGLVPIRRVAALAMTPETLRAAYNFLNETAPFDRWNLPDGDDVEFRVVRDPSLFGWYLLENGRHIIGISTATVGHTDTLIRTMGHEMVHVHEHCSGPCKRGHSRTFRAYAKQVCKAHGFDPKAF